MAQPLVDVTDSLYRAEREHHLEEGEVRFPVKRRLSTSTVGQCSRLTADMLLSDTACSELSHHRVLSSDVEKSCSAKNSRLVEKKQLCVIKMQKTFL